MNSLPDGYRALVIGSSGGIGAALREQLAGDPRCAEVLELGRHTRPHIDYHDEHSIAAAAAALRERGPLHLLLLATGVLSAPGRPPEKRLGQIGYAQMLDNFIVNTVGPACVLRHFCPLLAPRERSLVAALSAKVGSIGDNRLGGWYSYRASKAALNMVLRTAAIELGRSHPQAVVAALHPGTVDTRLSAPFRAPGARRAPSLAAAELLQVLDRLGPEHSGGFWSYSGERLPW